MCLSVSLFAMPFRLVRSFLAAAIVTVQLASCVGGPATISPLYDRLSGRGPIVLGDDNPYLPANAFFQEQLKGSRALARFVEANGEPTAMSLERKLYRKTRLGLFYADAGREHIFVRGIDDWQLERSVAISPDDQQSLSVQLAQSGRLAQVLRYQPSPDAEVSVAEATIQPSPDAELRGRLKPPESAGEARLTRLPNGNYEHRVTFPGETLRVIAEWYAEDPGAAGAIAVASGRSGGDPLRIGDRITIPKRLMRNVQPLPEAALP